MSHGPFDRGSAFYCRREPTRNPRKTFLIITEGEKTEPVYFDTLRARLRLTTVEVRVHHPEATDPRSLTEEAISLRKERAREARRGQGVPYDEVWLVYDLEKPHDERRRLHKNEQSKQKVNQILTAISDPAFEYWLLLHYRYTTSPFDDCNAVVKQLRRHLQDYDKKKLGVPELRALFEQAIEHTVHAVKNAEQCRKHHCECSGSGNPSTSVDALVRALNAVAAEAYRMQIPDPK